MNGWLSTTRPLKADSLYNEEPQPLVSLSRRHTCLRYQWISSVITTKVMMQILWSPSPTMTIKLQLSLIEEPKWAYLPSNVMKLGVNPTLTQLWGYYPYSEVTKWDNYHTLCTSRRGHSVQDEVECTITFPSTIMFSCPLECNATSRYRRATSATSSGADARRHIIVFMRCLRTCKRFLP